MPSKRFLTVLFVAALLATGLLRAGPASAVTIDPAGPFQADGFLNVQPFGLGGHTCQIGLGGTVHDLDGDGYGEGFVSITSVTFSGLQTCGSWQLHGLPYEAEFVDQDTFVIYDFAVDIGYGNCSGHLEGDWINSSSEIVYDGAPLGGAFGNCRVYSVVGPSNHTIDGLDVTPTLDVQP